MTKLTIPDDEPQSGFKVHAQLCMALNQYFRDNPSKLAMQAEIVKLFETSGMLMESLAMGNLTISLPAFLELLALIDDPEFLERLTQYSAFTPLAASQTNKATPSVLVSPDLLDDLDMDFIR